MGIHEKNQQSLEQAITLLETAQQVIASGGGTADEIAGMVGQSLQLLNGINLQPMPVPGELLRASPAAAAAAGNATVRLPTVHEIAKECFVAGQYQANPPSPDKAYEQASKFVAERKKQLKTDDRANNQ